MHHRSTYSLVLVLGLMGSGSAAFAQQYDEPPVEPEEGYDQEGPYGEEVPYDEADAPYDDYDVEPYDDSSGQPPSDELGSVDTFYDALAPYGRWVESPEYGLIWAPSRSVVGPGFVPYATGGSWQYTDVGWMFVSDWNWGWAPFHYGRWYRDPRMGWVWVPGSVWAPAWVDWRFGGGMIGWAPLPPRHHRTVWVFAHARDIHRPQIHRYVVRPSPRFYRDTAPVRHRVRSGRAYWYSGPPRDQVERVTRVRVRPLRFRPPRRRGRPGPRTRRTRARGAGRRATEPRDHQVAPRSLLSSAAPRRARSQRSTPASRRAASARPRTPRRAGSAGPRTSRRAGPRPPGYATVA